MTEALNGRGLPRLLETVEILCEFEQIAVESETDIRPQTDDDKMKLAKAKEPTLQETTVSLLLLAMFFATVALLVAFPPSK